MSTRTGPRRAASNMVTHGTARIFKMKLKNLF